MPLPLERVPGPSACSATSRLPAASAASTAKAGDAASKAALPKLGLEGNKLKSCWLELHGSGSSSCLPEEGCVGLNHTGVTTPPSLPPAARECLPHGTKWLASMAEPAWDGAGASVRSQREQARTVETVADHHHAGVSALPCHGFLRRTHRE